MMTTRICRYACAALAVLPLAVRALELTVSVSPEGSFVEKGLQFSTRNTGDLVIADFGGRKALTGRMVYVRVDCGQTGKMVAPTEAVTKEFALEVEYYDGATGKVNLAYDSADESHVPVPSTPGAWKRVPPIELKGAGVWKKVVLALPWARFDRKGLNGFDLRFEPLGALANKGVWAIGSLRLFVRNRVEEKLDPRQMTVLENECLRLTFDGLRVRELYDKRRKLQIFKAASISVPILELTAKRPGPALPETLRLWTALAKPPAAGGTPQEPTLRLEYAFKNGVVARPCLRLTRDGQVEWTLAIDCPADREVCSVNYPRLHGLAIGGDPEDDFFYNGQPWRQVWVQAHRRTSGGYKPQMSATRFQMAWDEQAAVYLGIEDPEQNDWRFFINADGCGKAQMGASLGIRARAGKTWTGNVVWRLAVTDGGTWHKAAAIARDYNRRTLRRPRVPDYVKWLADDWIYPNSNEFPRRGWDVLNGEDADRGSRRSFGTNDAWYADAVISCGNRQMIDGPCGAYCGRYPYPSLVWGSLDEFQQKLALHRALGGFYIPYFNFNLFSPGYLRHKRLGAFAKSLMPKDEPIPDEAWFEKVSARSYDGKINRTQLDSWFGEYDMSVLSPEWRDWQLQWMKRYVQWGTDGMYLDQLNMCYGNAWLWPGYEDSYGSWLKASRDSVARFVRDTRKLNPYAFYSGEVANEVIAQELDISMTSGVFDHHEIFRFANPWAIVMDGKFNGARQSEKYRFNWQSGARFEQGMVPYRNYLALRKRVKSLLYDAEFRDGENLVCRRDGAAVPERYPLEGKGQLRYPPNEGLLAKWFVFKSAAQRGAVVNVINVTDEKETDKFGNVRVVRSIVGKNATVTVPTDELGAVKAAYAFTLEGKVKRLDVRSRPSSVSFDVPEAEASSVVLSNGRLRPLVAWEHDPVRTPGAKGAVLLKVTNVNDKPMKCVASLRAGDDGARWLLPSEEKSLELSPGETRELSLPYEVSSRATLGRHDLWADVTAATGTFSAYHYVVVNEPLLADLRGVRGEYHVWFRNLSETLIEGRLSGHGKDGLVVKPAQAKVVVPAKSVLRVPVAVEGADALMEGSEISVAFKSDAAHFAKTVTRVKAVFPLLPNRNFEIDHAGDGKPDWWMCRKGMDWAYECMNLSTNAHSGRYALELKPFGRFSRGVWAIPTIFDAKIGRTYRLSFWSKAPQGGKFMFAGEVIRLPKSAEWVKTEKTLTVREVRWNYCNVTIEDGPILIDDIEIAECP